MRIGLAICNFPDSINNLGERFLSLVSQIETAGFDSVWVCDHFLGEGDPVGPGVTDLETLEAYTMLGFIAAATKVIKLGAIVTGVTYRHPGVLIKQVTTLDILSQGRVYFGIGAAWFEEEHKALGIFFPPRKDRFEMLEETVQIAMQMWADGGKYDQASAFIGKHYQLERTLNVPQSIQRPHPPILIGGNGEQKTLHLVAKYANACNFVGTLSSGELIHKLEVLRIHCQSLGRSFQSIEKTFYDYSINITQNGHLGTMSIQEGISYFESLAQIGIETVIIDNSIIDFFDPTVVDFWATKLLPFIKSIPVAPIGA